MASRRIRYFVTGAAIVIALGAVAVAVRSQRFSWGEEVSKKIVTATGTNAGPVHKTTIVAYQPNAGLAEDRIQLAVHGLVVGVPRGIRLVQISSVPRCAVRVTVTTPQGLHSHEFAKRDDGPPEESQDDPDSLNFMVEGKFWKIRGPYSEIVVQPLGAAKLYTLHTSVSWGFDWRARRFDVQQSFPQRCSYQQSVFGLAGDEPHFTKQIDELLKSCGWTRSNTGQIAKQAISNLTRLPARNLATRWLEMDGPTLRSCKDINSAAEAAAIMRGKVVNSYPTEKWRVLQVNLPQCEVLIRPYSDGGQTDHCQLDAFSPEGACLWSGTMRAEAGHLTPEQAADFIYGTLASAAPRK